MADPLSRPCVVFDVGSGCSRFGFSHNAQPTFTMPTLMATREFDIRAQKDAGPKGGGVGGGLGLKGSKGLGASSGLLATAGGSKCGLEDLDVHIGEEAVLSATTYSLTYPVKQGVVENWDLMERYWQQAIFQYLRVEPEDHVFVVAEPALVLPEAREQMAEVMFETFGVAGLLSAVQPVLALYATVGQTLQAMEGAAAPGSVPNSGAPGLLSQPAVQQYKPVPLVPPEALTGMVVDCGEGSTSVVPVVDGYVVRSGVRRMPLGGRDITAMVQQSLRDRGEPVPPDYSFEAARQAKEAHCYVCSGDLAKERAKAEAAAAAAASAAGAGAAGTAGTVPVRVRVSDPRAGSQDLGFGMGHERYLAPEILFRPSLCPAPGAAAATPLPQLVDDVVRGCPIDTRRALYGCVVLAGGTTRLKNFGRRMQVELATLANSRVAPGATAIEVAVASGKHSAYAAWLGGAMLAEGARTYGRAAAAVGGGGGVLVTRAEYQERGAAAVCEGLGAGLML